MCEDGPKLKVLRHRAPDVVVGLQLLEESCSDGVDSSRNCGRRLLEREDCHTHSFAQALILKMLKASPSDSSRDVFNPFCHTCCASVWTLEKFTC